MSDAPNSSPAGRAWLGYGLIMVITACITVAIVALLMNIQQRKAEGERPHFTLVELDETVVDPAEWGKNFPRQYDSYRRTVDTSRTRHGGSEAYDRLVADPRLKRIFAGYAFAIDYREERGHAYMLSDQDETERTKKVKQPGACIHCHASVLPAYRKEGDGNIMKGFEKVCAMPLPEARKLVSHPVTCLDCHDPKTMQLRVTRPGFLNAIQVLAASEDPLPHLASINRWRAKKSSTPYDPNTEASRQEMRSFVCGQCHVEYYFKGEGKLVTYPWHNGLKMEKIEAYYDKEKFRDWVHAETGAQVLKAQHPEFELWNQGIHARSGVACADCHMPYVREGAMKVSDHHVRSPMLNVARACQTCHRYPEEEIKARVAIIQDRTKGMLDRAEDALVNLIDNLKAAQERKQPVEVLDKARTLQRKAQWRVDFVNAENSMGFHASQEAARILGEAIDYARQGQIELLGGSTR
ncbi:MAG: ammonia-forming cytochrome c nitrite reductase subunit c552 [Gemmataceae bacterium]